MTGDAKTRVIVVGRPEEDLSHLTEAAQVLREGGLVAFPTETVYGLGANALDHDAVARLYNVKQRPPAQPFSVMVASVADALRLARNVSDSARKLMAAYLPGPLTIILHSSNIVPDIVTAGSGRIGIRVPDHPLARAFVEACQCPVAAPSANLHGHPSPRSADEVLAQLEGRIDIVLDGGPARLGLESTVIDMTAATPTVVRVGAVSVEELQAHLGRSIVVSNARRR